MGGGVFCLCVGASSFPFIVFAPCNFCRAVVVKDSYDIICHSVYITNIAQNRSFVKHSQRSHVLLLFCFVVFVFVSRRNRITKQEKKRVNNLFLNICQRLQNGIIK